jgi:hypothetical protein
MDSRDTENYCRGSSMEYTIGNTRIGKWALLSGVLEPRQVTRFLSSPQPSLPALRPMHPTIQGVKGYFLEGKMARTWCWPLTSVCYQRKSKWSYNYTPSICPHAILRRDLYLHQYVHATVCLFGHTTVHSNAHKVIAGFFPKSRSGGDVEVQLPS